MFVLELYNSLSAFGLDNISHYVFRFPNKQRGLYTCVSMKKKARA